MLQNISVSIYQTILNTNKRYVRDFCEKERNENIYDRSFLIRMHLKCKKKCENKTRQKRIENRDSEN